MCEKHTLEQAITGALQAGLGTEEGSMLADAQEELVIMEAEEAAQWSAVERPVPVLFGDDSDAEPHEQLAATDADGTPITRVELACTQEELDGLEANAPAAAAGLPCRALGEEQRVVRAVRECDGCAWREAEMLGAVREAIPGELGRRAAFEFTRAVTKFSRAEDGATLLASADALAPHAGPSILVLRPVRSTCVSVAQVC